VAELLARTSAGRLDLVSVRPAKAERVEGAPTSTTSIDAYLDHLAWAMQPGDLTVGTSVTTGSIPEAIASHATEAGADVIVIATHSRSRAQRLVRRNTAIAVVRATKLPVLILRPTDAWTSRHTAFRKLLVSLDGSAGAEEVLPFARIIAHRFGSALVLLTIPEAESEVPRLEHYLESVAAALRNIGLAAETRVTGSEAGRTISGVAESEGCDLIMMATRGRGAPEESDVEVGSVAEHVVESAHCPVIAIAVRGLARAPR